MCVFLRRHTVLPSEDCLHALQAGIPRLPRSALHRSYQRHGISRPPDAEGGKPRRSKLGRRPVGVVHADSAKVRIEESGLHLSVAIDRTGELAAVKLVRKAVRMAAAWFPRDVIAALPYRIRTVLHR